METSKKKAYKKMVVYITEEERTALRIHLLKQGKSVSAWFREVVKALLQKET